MAKSPVLKIIKNIIVESAGMGHSRAERELLLEERARPATTEALACSALLCAANRIHPLLAILLPLGTPIGHVQCFCRSRLRVVYFTKEPIPEETSSPSQGNERGARRLSRGALYGGCYSSRRAGGSSTVHEREMDFARQIHR